MAQKTTKRPFTILRIVKRWTKMNELTSEYYLLGIKIWAKSVEGPYLGHGEDIDSIPSKGVDARELLQQIYSGRLL